MPELCELDVADGRAKRRVDLFDYQKDMVKLLSSEPDLLAIGPRPRGIQQFANPGKIFPWFELRRLVSESEGDLRLVLQRVENFSSSLHLDISLFEELPSQCGDVSSRA